MFCIVSAVVLSILGIFSAENRTLAREALDCVFRRVTLRPCNTGFDEKMKAKILGRVITRSEGTARFLNKNFEVMAWIFFVVMLTALIFFLRGLFLFYTTGSCNGVNSSAFCVFDPTGANNQVSTGYGCSVKPKSAADVTLKNTDLTGIQVMNPDAPDKIVMIGCYHCDYTRKVYPEIRQLVNRYQPSFTFFNYPVKEETDYFTRLGYCVYRQDPEKYWKFNDLMFTGDKADLDVDANIQKILNDSGLDAEAVNVCVKEPATEGIVQQQMKEIQKTKFYGTPTLFINDNEALVGPKPYRVFAIALKGLFYWLR